MKKIFLLSIICLSICTAKSQTFLEHCLGLGVSIKTNPTTWISTPEYELSILNDSKGYNKGFITGAGVSFDISNFGDNYSPFIKVGYRLSNISLGITGGIKKESINEYPYGSKTSSNFGGWVAFNANRNIKIQAFGNEFSGIGLSVIFRLHKP